MQLARSAGLSLRPVHRIASSRRPSAGARARRGRASALRASAALSGPLETVVSAAETVAATVPKVEQALVDGFSATAPLRDGTARAFKPILDAFVSFATRQASEPAVQSAVKSASSSLAGSLGDVQTAIQPAAAALSPELAAAAAAGVGLLALGRLVLLVAGGRRYKADLRPSEALNSALLSGSTLIDIRPQADVSAKGNPALSGGAAARLRRVPLEDDLVDKGKLRSPKDVLRSRLALRIGNLKGCSRSSPIILLDSQGGEAPAVANELAKAGFSDVSVVAGGFSAWLDSKLPSKAAFQALGADAGYFPLLPTARSTPSRPVTVEVVAAAPAQRMLPAPIRAAAPPPKAVAVKPTGKTETVTATRMIPKAPTKPSPAKAAAAPVKKAGSTVVVANKKGAAAATPVRSNKK